MKLRVWWLPQLGCLATFYVPVETIAEGVKMIDTLAEYDRFQRDNRIKPDYCNAGGLQMFDPDDDTDGPDGSWVDWCDEQTGEDEPKAFLEHEALKNGD